MAELSGHGCGASESGCLAMQNPVQSVIVYTNSDGFDSYCFVFMMFVLSM